jgi:hypothetical protein
MGITGAQQHDVAETESQCSFDPLQYSTVTVQYDIGYTRKSKCWRNACTPLDVEGATAFNSIYVRDMFNLLWAPVGSMHDPLWTNIFAGYPVIVT